MNPGRPARESAQKGTDARLSKLAKGLCPWCTNKLEKGKKACSTCLERNRVQVRQKVSELRAIVLSHYGCKCNLCEESILSFLTIDHVNNDGHTHRTKAGNRVRNYTLYNEIINAGFPDRFQILCFNCNCAKQIVGLPKLLETLHG